MTRPTLRAWPIAAFLLLTTTTGSAAAESLPSEKISVSDQTTKVVASASASTRLVLWGTVTDASTGKPVAGACPEVTLTADPTSAFGGECTEADGVFRFDSTWFEDEPGGQTVVVRVVDEQGRYALATSDPVILDPAGPREVNVAMTRVGATPTGSSKSVEPG